MQFVARDKGCKRVRLVNCIPRDHHVDLDLNNGSHLPEVKKNPAASVHSTTLQRLGLNFRLHTSLVFRVTNSLR